MDIVVTGSIAFDYLMSFPGKFTEHFLPEHMSRVSLSFLVDTMDKRRGGCAPNIAYTLALLGERPRLMATAGQDFDDYRRWLEAAGVDTSLVTQCRRQVHRVVLLQHRRPRTTRSRRSTPARWPTPASCRSATSPAARLAIISPNDPGGDGAVRGGVPHARHPVHLGSGPAVRADVGRRAARRPRRRAHRDLQRLRVRADPAEDRLDEAAILGASRRADRHARRARLARSTTRRRTRRRARPCRRAASSIRPASATRSAAGF